MNDQNLQAFSEMFGTPGEAVPEVDTDDLKAVWWAADEIQKEHQKTHPGKQIGIGRQLLSHYCKPGADMKAICYRIMHLGLIKMMADMPRSTLAEMAEAQEKAATILKGGEVTDATFNAASKIPMTFVRQGLPFDFDEFLKLCA